MTGLSSPIDLRGQVLRNRVMISPMCTYSCAADGLATDWHFVHYGRFALGGAGMVMLEATSVVPEGRHCYSDLGIWSDAHVPPLARIAGFIRSQGAVPAIQLQHAGRKGSARRPWHGGGPMSDEDLRDRDEAPWQTVGPSAVALRPDAPVPRELDEAGMDGIRQAFVDAARRAVDAGFGAVEVHAAHGYLLNQFLSPIANHRTDGWGGSLANRMRFPLSVVEAVRAAIPDDTALIVRVSAVDGVDEGWTLGESVMFARELRARGVDAIDCSSGGIGGAATMNRLARSPGFQVPFAEAIRREAGIATIAVGLILTPEQAERAVAGGRTDIVAIGREALANPNWPNAALTALGGSGDYDHWPPNVGWWLGRRADIIRGFEAEPDAALILAGTDPGPGA
ncbi:NADH:flavin oxidoreductase/NADH oxidase [Rhodobacterales bacterium HKCCE2091]|nr:NADH:flavin oxidoreductase/NADH oxidase [Rhodobacterales bacterium HKCCE2091]